MMNSAEEREKIERRRRSRKFQKAKRAWKRLFSAFGPWYPDYLEYQHVLGHGGFGIVQKWHVYEETGAFNRPVAIKTITKPRNQNGVEAMRREIYWMKRFKGSRHLVQLVDLDPEVMDSLDINDQDGNGNQPILVMEELGQSSLAHLLYRIGRSMMANRSLPVNQRKVEYIPQRALWRIFLCLTRACIAIAYPDDQRNLASSETLLGMQPWAIPAPRRIVHSDIDIFNVFVADPDANAANDNEHAYFPLVKIADYGCMVEWDESWSPETKLNAVWGKHKYKAPEQRGNRPLQFGALASHTNVFQIGGVMHDLITRKPMTGEGRSCFERLVTPGRSPFETYGWRLIFDPDWDNNHHDYMNVSEELRALTAGCMAKDPAWRPNLIYLETMIMNGMRAFDESIARRAQQVNALQPAFPGSYRRRPLYGVPEPDHIVDKFYQEYFVDKWDIPDKLHEYWDATTLTPSGELTRSPDDGIANRNSAAE